MCLPRLDMFIQIAKYFGLTLDEMAGMDQSITPQNHGPPNRGSVPAHGNLNIDFAVVGGDIRRDKGAKRIQNRRRTDGALCRVACPKFAQ